MPSLGIYQGKCKGCGYEGRLYTKKLCPLCAAPKKKSICKSNHKDATGLRSVKGSTLSRESFLSTSKSWRKSTSGHKLSAQDEQFYRYLWESMPRYCVNCLKSGKSSEQAYLGEKREAHFFSHILPKGAYPKIRYLLINIDISCWDCHQIWGAGAKETMVIYDESKLAALRLIDTNLPEACWLVPETLLSDIK